jgi:predicted DCC family thiol-disulfide oxidoreductase YuxK
MLRWMGRGWGSVSRVLRRYFSEADSPYNLALFRIVLFSCVLLSLDVDGLIWYSRVPVELRFPPFGMSRVLSVVPVTPALVHDVAVLFIFFSLLGLLGWFARLSSLAAALCGIYAWGTPQLFGKIDHVYHVLIWFMIILSASDCADVLSIDAIGKAFREADQGRLPNNGVSRKYGLPLRFIWLLMGIIYFFPGLWKLLAGWRWEFSDSLKYRLYEKWFILGWVPSFRIDQHPWLLRLSAFATVSFELTFVFMIFFPWARWVAVAGGVFFHFMTNFFMRITFYQLQVCLVSFIDWAGIFVRAGAWLFKEPLYLFYDGNCKICRRTIFSIRQFDVFQRVVYVNALGREDVVPAKVPSIAAGDLARDMHAVIGREKRLGYEAYRALALRIPIFWPWVPFLWLWPVPVLGKLIYRKVADSRLCQRRTVPIPVESVRSNEKSQGIKIIKWVGFFLLFVNSILGLDHMEAAWPFSCFPTFSALRDAPRVEKLMVYGVAGKTEHSINFEGYFAKYMENQKISNLTFEIMNTPDGALRDSRFKSLVRMAGQTGVDLSGYSKIRFYKEDYDTDPDSGGHSALSRELLMEYDPQP